MAEETQTSATSSPTWVDSITAKRPIIGQDMGIPHNIFNDVIREQVENDPDRLQYVSCDGTNYTLKQFYDLSERVARAITTFGLLPLEGVSIIGFNSIEWFSIDVGATLASCVSSGIYTTNKPDIVAYIVNHSQSRLIFVDNKAALKKVLSVLDKCPKLQKIITWGEYNATEFTENEDMIMTWKDFLQLADASEAKEINLRERENELSPESLCKLIYTSGTTGPPKAVMISHDNVCYISVQFGSNVAKSGPGDRVISFLPLSHIAANTVDICGAIVTGYTVYLADSNALKGTLVETMKKVRPTLFLGIPRVFEKMQEAMISKGATAGAIKKAIANWAKHVGMEASKAKDTGHSMPFTYPIAKMLVFSKVSDALGLDQCRLIINASAPMQKSTDAYFKSLDIRIHDLYGMSEATGPISVNYPDYKAGTSGKLIPGTDIKLVNKISDTEGELCFRGRNMFMGYLNNPEECEKTVDDEGFVHSGDIGHIDEEGFLTITGRAKDLLITSGGENVAPFLVESSLISAMPAIGRAVALGDQKKFISALVIPLVDEKGELVGPAKAVNPNLTKGEEVVNDEAWMSYLKKGVEKANEEAISNAVKVKQFRVLGTDFSVDNGELTPTMKVKRNIVVEKYADVIDNMYQ